MKKVIIVWGIGTIMAIQAVVELVLAKSQSIRLDESQSLWIAAKSLEEMLKVTGQDVHVPLYFSLLHLIIKMGGVDIGNGRILSLIFSVICTPLLYVLCRKVSNVRVAIIATCLFGLSPFVLWYGAEIRMYSLFLMITIINNIFYADLINSKGSKGKLGYFVSMVLGLYTHYFFGLTVITQILYSFARKRARVEIVGIVCGAWLFLLPWLLYVMSLGGASNTRPIIEKPSSFNIVLAFVNFLFGFHDSKTEGLLVSLWPLSIVGLLAVFTHKNIKRVRNLGYYLIVVFVPIAIVFLLSFIQPIFLARYLIFVLPSLYIVMAWVIANQGRKLILGIMFLIMATSSGLLVNQTLATTTPVKEDYSGLVRHISTEAKPSDIVVISPPFTIYPIEYQYIGNSKLVTMPDWNRYVSGPIPTFKNADMVEQVKYFTSIYNYMYLVTSYDQGYQDEIVDYMDKNYLRTNAIKFPNMIELRVYKLRY